MKDKKRIDQTIYCARYLLSGSAFLTNEKKILLKLLRMQEMFRYAALLTGGELLEGFDTAGYWDNFKERMRKVYKLRCSNRALKFLYERCWECDIGLWDMMLCWFSPQNRELYHRLLKKYKGEIPISLRAMLDRIDKRKDHGSRITSNSGG